MWVFLFVASTIAAAFGAANPHGWGVDCDGCVDYYGGCRPVGAEWTEDGTWDYACPAEGQLTFLGCRPNMPLVDSGRVATGGEASAGGFWHRCEATDARLHYSQEPFCEMNGTRLHVGETWREGVFERSCAEWGVAVDGCWVAAEDGAEAMLRVGQKISHGLVTHSCVRVTRFPGRIQYFTKVARAKNVVSPAGRSRNGHLPAQDSVNLLAAPPRLWRQERASELVRSDGLFRAKIRFLN